MTATTGAPQRTAYPSGPLCRSCRTNEARCAYNLYCCDDCTHFPEAPQRAISARTDYWRRVWQLRKAQNARRSA